MAIANTWSFTKHVFAAGLLTLGVATGASATTLGDVTLSGSPIFNAPSLDVIVDDAGTGNFFLEATNFFNVTVILDYDDATETGIESTSPFDLSAEDIVTADAATGSALDFAFDYADDTLSILFDLGTNDFSADPFGVAVLYFDLDIDGTFGFADLDFELVEMDLFGAAVAPIPVPATLPLILVGLAGLGWVGRRRSS